MGYTPGLDISVRFAVPVETVWNAVVQADTVALWWPSGGHIDAEKGGSVHLVTPRIHKKRDRTISGKVLRVEKHAEIVMAVNAQPRDRNTRLTLQFSQLKNKSRLRIIEESGEGENAPDVVLKEARDGWREVLAALDEHLSQAQR